MSARVVVALIPVLCPYCRSPVAVRGRATRFYYCEACRCAVDPVSGAKVKLDTKLNQAENGENDADFPT